MDSELEAILAESDGSDDGVVAGLSLEDILKEDEALGGDESPGLAQALSYARLREDDDEAPASGAASQGCECTAAEAGFVGWLWRLVQHAVEVQQVLQHAAGVLA